MVSETIKNTDLNKFRIGEKLKIKPKSTYISIQNEEEEDRELLNLLEGKSTKSKKINLINIIFQLDNSIQYGKKINSISEVIKEEDENIKNNVKGIRNNEMTIKNSKIENNGKIIINHKMSFNNILKNKLNINNNFQKIPVKTPNRSRKIKNRNISTNQIKGHKYINLNNIGNDNSEYINSLKQAISYNIGIQNKTENESKLRSGLLSAGRTTNNNDVIIPLISTKRPNSNFIFGGEQLWNNFMNGVKKVKTIDKNNINYGQIPSEKNDTNLKRFIQINSRMKKNKIYNLYNKSRNNKIHNLNKKYNRFMGLEAFDRETLLNKLHKIKIEKGMMNSGFISSINQKLLGDNKQFKSTYLPMVIVDSRLKINKKNRAIKFEKSNKNLYISKSLDKDNN